MREYVLTQQPGLTTSEFVWFRLREPTDEHEACLSLSLSRATWEAQGSPEEIRLALTVPVVT